MTTNRLAILLVVVVAGMSSIFLLPIVHNAQPTGIDLKLPPLVNEWYGKDEVVSEREHGILGPETEFSRKSYRNEQGDELYVSIVLAGQDMNTSIHRPERCLPAQGFTISDSRVESVLLNDAGKHVLNVTRLRNFRPIKNSSGDAVNLYNLNYYWFVGCSDTTPSHFVRTYYDVRDRIMKGYNQRWAYVTVAAFLNRNQRTEEETDRIIQSFIRELVPKVHKPSVQYH